MGLTMEAIRWRVSRACLGRDLEVRCWNWSTKGSSSVPLVADDILVVGVVGRGMFEERMQRCRISNSETEIYTMHVATFLLSLRAIVVSLQKAVVVTVKDFMIMPPMKERKVQGETPEQNVAIRRSPRHLPEDARTPVPMFVSERFVMYLSLMVAQGKWDFAT